MTGLAEGGGRRLRESEEEISLATRFRLRKEQLEAMRAASDKILIERIVKHLRSQCTAEVTGVSEEVLRKRVVGGVKRARSYGMKWESSLMSFVVLMFHIAPNFDEQPNIRRALTDESRKPDERMQDIESCATTDDWKQAKAKADPKAWEKLPS
ncbi:MAG: hypothetical protein HY235_21755 [Acidobacteria bacterium]|nr:hypothetical protein [Acidobacteriota bacterium]